MQTARAGLFFAGLGALLAQALTVSPGQAASGANYVLYNHHTADAGEKEIKLLSDFGSVGDGGTDYFAQLVEIEYGVTDRWTTALYFEGAKSEGDDYAFGGWRFENRYRLFEGDVFLNPVLYVEYEQLEPEHRYKRAVKGRTDGEEEGGEEESTEHELETKLLLGKDVTDRLDVAFNWINETNLDTGKWEFGYAVGFNYVLFETSGSEGRGHGLALKELKLGVEFFGGLGDSEKGLTFDGSKTEQYGGVNLKGEFANGMQMGAGIAAGLTDDSQDLIVRTMIGYEFK